MKTTIHKRRGFTLVELLVVIAIIATLAGVATPVLLSQRKRGDMTEAIMNAKQIGLALFNFDEEYGNFPDDTTLQDMKDDNGGTAPDPSSSAGGSNEYFAQLYAAGYIDQEVPFFAKGPMCRKKPDNDVTGAKCLEGGEVGFGYVMKSSGVALNSSNNSAIPLLVAPNAEGSDGEKFDQDAYNKKAIVLRIDMSATAATVKTDQTIKELKTGTGTPFDASGITSPDVVAPAKPGN